jgi:hypothetical protein
MVLAFTKNSSKCGIACNNFDRSMPKGVERAILFKEGRYVNKRGYIDVFTATYILDK